MTSDYCLRCRNTGELDDKWCDCPAGELEREDDRRGWEWIRAKVQESMRLERMGLDDEAEAKRKQVVS